MIGAFRFWRKRGPCDRAECEKLLAAHYKPIYAYLRRLCGDSDEAQDLTQETFAKVWKALLAQHRAGNLRAWIYRIARNTFIDSARRRGRMQTRSDEWWENLPAPEQTGNGIAEREIAVLLAQKVHELDSDKREAVILHFYQGLTLRETAEVTGVAASTVKYRLREAIAILREQVGRVYDPTLEPTAARLKKETRCHENG